jgi:hypothetical protein
VLLRHLTFTLSLTLVTWATACDRPDKASPQPAASPKPTQQPSSAASIAPSVAQQRESATPFSAEMVVQVPTSPGLGSVEELRARHALEDQISEFFTSSKLGTVDGGDMGSGKLNVFMFIAPGARDEVLAAILAILEKRKLSEVAVVAYYVTSDAEPVVLWPKHYKGTFSAL